MAPAYNKRTIRSISLPIYVPNSQRIRNRLMTMRPRFLKVLAPAKEKIT